MDTAVPFEQMAAAIKKAHNYDLPMIIYEPAAPESSYARGEFEFKSPADAKKKARELIAAREAACVQVLGKSASIKTNRKHVAEVDRLVGSGVDWQGIGGNTAYLKWIDDETASGRAPAMLQHRAGALPLAMPLIYAAVPVVGLGLFVGLMHRQAATGYCSGTPVRD
eukprot:TRINITY_DN12288_c0_g1_i4.p2 TRINITY_DN12288_c0_g1~~TRINITY_DN12288_c0_g1_i4.p2  ORF type:complete len:167 (+),score=41.83 TRINITY_DN12288_c0_g1_i4:301-801(+)